MANVFSVSSNKCAIKLNLGTQSGRVVTANVSLGRLSSQTGDIQDNSEARDKAMAVVNLLSNCLAKDIYSVEATRSGSLREE